MQTTYLQYSFVYLLAILILQYYLTKVEIYYKQTINKITREEQNGREKKEETRTKAKQKQMESETHTNVYVSFSTVFDWH